MQLIGDRQHVLEGELRRRMGNNPDTSKALRYTSACVCLFTRHAMGQVNSSFLEGDQGEMSELC